MKIPKARQLPSGMWFCQLRLAGNSISITKPTEEECAAEAIKIKTRYKEEKLTLGEKQASRSALFTNKHNGLSYVCGRYMQSDNVVDKGITLKKLFKRDDGICHICGGKCDYEDYWYTKNDIFVAGDNYPVIDHVIPVKKGGVHSWENVRLAHKLCNTKKSDELPYPTTADLYSEYKKIKFTNMSEKELFNVVQGEISLKTKDSGTALSMLINQHGYRLEYYGKDSILFDKAGAALKIPNFSVWDYIRVPHHFYT